MKSADTLFKCAVLLLLVSVTSEELTTILKALRPLYECAPRRIGPEELCRTIRVTPAEDYDEFRFTFKAHPRLTAHPYKRATRYPEFSNTTRKIPLWYAKPIQERPELLKLYLPRYSKDRPVTQYFYVAPPTIRRDTLPMIRRMKRMVKMKKKKRNKQRIFFRNLRHPSTPRLYARWTVTIPKVSRYDDGGMGLFPLLNNSTYEDEYDESETGSSEDYGEDLPTSGNGHYANSTSVL